MFQKQKNTNHKTINIRNTCDVIYAKFFFFSEREWLYLYKSEEYY